LEEEHDVNVMEIDLKNNLDLGTSDSNKNKSDSSSKWMKKIKAIKNFKKRKQEGKKNV
jgi:hypothetical protein